MAKNADNLNKQLMAKAEEILQLKQQALDQKEEVYQNIVNL